MGKAGKTRKKRRLASVETVHCKSSIDSEDLSTTINTLKVLASDVELFKSADMRPLRSLLHLLVDSSGNTGKSLSGVVSDSLRDGRSLDAYHALLHMHSRGITPKVGALCRWVRDADAVRRGTAGGVVEPDPTIIACLDLIMRVCDPVRYPYTPPSGSIVFNSEPWKCTGLFNKKSGCGIQVVNEDQSRYWKSKFIEVYRELAQQRTPPNTDDLIIHLSSPNACDLNQELRDITRVEVPFLPKAFSLLNVFSPDECSRIICAAESVGFVSDNPVGDSDSVLAHNFVWLLDSETESLIFDRVKAQLPAEIDGCEVLGINRRWRIYRYSDPAQAYRCHIDGAWTGSGTVPNLRQDGFPDFGEYLPDAHGDRSSRLTFLIYLNEGFEGGETIYHLPSSQLGKLEACRVAPRTGSAMLFPHSSVADNYLHEGSAVFKGCKYIARTEVLYRGFEKS